MPKKSRAYFLVSTALMSALSIIFDLMPAFRALWGMKIDFVGTIWVLTFFLYGLAEASYVSIITTIFILIWSPTGLVGATMKFIATIPMFLVPAALQYLPYFSPKTSKMYDSIPVLLISGVLANLTRILIASIVNYYWAIPLWLGMPSEAILQTMFGGSILGFIVFVAGMNILQGIIDIIIPWLLAYKFKLSTLFGTW
jgi:riboflavin transporter FmnP